MSTYLFYDIESTGLNRCFDQIIQFAAIRCDKAFNEIERHQFLVKLNCDMIPHPEALLTHEISLQTINQGISELTAIKKIHALLNQPGTISLGYNTLNFDDELLRFSFYRNLLPPYTHQYANQCYRMDIYPMIQLYYLFKPDLINWPLNANGIPSLKLEAINNENCLFQGRAHDAMVDVSVTIELAKRLAQASEMWDYLGANFIKATDQQRLDKLPSTFNQRRLGLLISGNLGASNAYQAPVISLGRHRHYTNQTLWLRLDLDPLRQSSVENFAQFCHVLNKKFAEPPFILPLTPRFMHHLDAQRQNQMEQNLQWLQENQPLLSAISSHYQQATYPQIADIDIDAALYTSAFWSRQESTEARAFHQADEEQKAKIVKEIGSQRMRDLAIRMLGRHLPQQLDMTQQRQFHHYMQKIFSPHPPIDFKGYPRYSYANARHDITHCRKSANLAENKQQLLDELENYLIQQHERYGLHLA